MRSALLLLCFLGLSLVSLSLSVSAQEEEQVQHKSEFIESKSLSLKIERFSKCSAPECVAAPNQTIYENIHNMLDFAIAAHHLHIVPLTSYAKLLNDTSQSFTAFVPTNEAAVKCREQAIEAIGCEGNTFAPGSFAAQDCETLMRMRDLDNRVEKAVEAVRAGKKKSHKPLGRYNLFVDPDEYAALNFSSVMKDYLRGALGHLLLPTPVFVNDLPLNTTNIFPTYFNSTAKGLLALAPIVKNTAKFDLLVVHAASNQFPDTLYLPYARMGANKNWTSTVIIKDVKSSNGVIQGVDTINPLPFSLKDSLKYNQYRGFTALLNYTHLLNLTSAVPELTVMVPTDEAFQAALPSLPAESEFKKVLQSALSAPAVQLNQSELFYHQVKRIAKVYKAFKNPLKMASKAYEKVAKELQYRIDTAIDKEMKLATRVAANHLFPGLIYSTNFTDGMQLTSLSNLTQTIHMDPANGRVWTAKTHIGNATLTWADMIVKNGVMHEIDSILLSPKQQHKLKEIKEKKKLHGEREREHEEE